MPTDTITTKKQQQKEVNNTDQQDEKCLVLHNDDYHTFDYVIEALIDVCHLDFMQAEQITMLVHYKGKCEVKNGTYQELKPYRDTLRKEKGLKATID